MKKAILLRIVVSMAISQIVNQTIGQQAEPWKVRRAYLNGMAGMKGTGKAQFNVYFNNTCVAFASFDGGTLKAKDQPADYSAGSSMLMGFHFDGDGPEDNFQLYTIGMGKIISPASDKAWLTASAGLSFGSYEQASFTKQSVESFNWIIIGGTSSNYSTSYEKKTMIGLNTGLHAHIVLARVMGLSAGIQGIFSNQGILPSFQLGMSLGLMRPSRKNMIRNPE